MALMKQLYSLPITEELSPYYGEYQTSNVLVELLSKTIDNPDKDFFILSLGGDLIVVSEDDLMDFLSDGWDIEADSGLIYENNLAQYSEAQ